MIHVSTTQAEKTEQTSLQITGMTCAACANRIEKGLQKMDGVSNANVNFALEKASVTYNPKVVNVPQMQERIQNLGYDTVKETMDFQITGMICAVMCNKD